MNRNADTQTLPVVRPAPRLKAWHLLGGLGVATMAAGFAMGAAAGQQSDAAAEAASAVPAVLEMAPEPVAIPADVTSPEAADEPEPVPAPDEPADEPEPPAPADTTAPTIHWITTPASPLQENNWQCTYTTATVTAKLSDNVGIAQARLVYWVPGNDAVDATMQLNAWGEYEAQVGPFAVGSVPEGDDHKTVVVGIVVDDAAGNTTEETVEITVVPSSCGTLGFKG